MKRKQTDTRGHREIIELLPWYVNGTLSPAEREAVAAHLAGCPDCLAEAGVLQAVGSAVKDSNERLPFPPDGRLDVLLSDIEKAEATRPGLKPLARLKGWWGPLPAFAKWGLAAQTMAVVALACASAVLLRRANLMEAAALRERQRAESLQGRRQAATPQERQHSEDPSATPAQGGQETQYQALSGQQEEVTGPAVRITVVFREDATEKEMRELLGAVNANIVGGPSPARFYDLSIAVPPGSDARKLADEVLQKLRGRGDVVRLAEPAP